MEFLDDALHAIRAIDQTNRKEFKEVSNRWQVSEYTECYVSIVGDLTRAEQLLTANYRNVKLLRYPLESVTQGREVFKKMYEILGSADRRAPEVMVEEQLQGVGQCYLLLAIVPVFGR